MRASDSITWFALVAAAAAAPANIDRRNIGGFVSTISANEGGVVSTAVKNVAGAVLTAVAQQSGALSTATLQLEDPTWISQLL